MTASPSTGRPRRVSLADGVYDELLSRLFDNTLPPGTWMNIDALARDLEVSQTPIREALARLESTGLVTRAALRGYRAAPLLTAKELGDLMHARAVVEPANAALAAAHATEAFLAGLDESIERLATSPTGPTVHEYHSYWQADEQFHDLIARQADNAFLYRAFESLGGQAQRFRMFGGLGVTDAEYAIAEHRAIRTALASGRPEAAEAAMLDHVVNVRIRSLD
ncbi:MULTISPECIES: GntR family transcriptional regulator [unclassified Frigoribacterium]|uniref:GntR family transcriptional regulator n=1 Tax=unclassified Frigoribacterium TaxID=2627005 RepID=UPI0006F413D3|nr:MULTISPECIES: GntR family transcriptional regulator [unclassified Frigoribacterium]KQO84616.1 GntR family transcriptional regulator [Frigoribacterium sp. Leaf263]KQR63963.1 GntR family transcriptional regulator [Frigoribacterium sp. Leaf172]